jgi:hypothetical protein
MSDQGNVAYDNGVPYDPATGELMAEIGGEVRRRADEDSFHAAYSGLQPPPLGPPTEPRQGSPELPLGIPEHVPGESRAEAFVRLAEVRVNRALKYIDRVGNLSNRASYDYDSVDVDEIMRVLREAVEDTARRFRSNSPRQEFRLRS